MWIHLAAVKDSNCADYRHTGVSHAVPDWPSAKDGDQTRILTQKVRFHGRCFTCWDVRRNNALLGGCARAKKETAHSHWGPSGFHQSEEKTNAGVMSYRAPSLTASTVNNFLKTIMQSGKMFSDTLHFSHQCGMFSISASPLFCFTWPWQHAKTLGVNASPLM